MASGATNLPLRERLKERHFLDLPHTQYSIPGPPPGGPLIFSVTDTLINAAGTTFVSDFNFDESVDALTLRCGSTTAFKWVRVSSQATPTTTA